MKEEIIQGLLDMGAIKLQPHDPFTWTSGIVSPIYCDNRLTIGNVKLRKTIAQELSKLVSEKYPDVELIGACATAGIPHGTSVADILDKDLIYFRSKPKDHGTNSTIEGFYTRGSKVVIIEDLISTGKSVGKAVEDAQEVGLEVLGVVSIFSYGLDKAISRLSSSGVNYFSLLRVTDLLAYENNGLNEQDKSVIIDFIKELNFS